MGDTCCSDSSMGAIKRLLEEMLPDVYVLSVRLGNSIEDDRKSGWLGDVNAQISYVCEMLAQDVNLMSGFNAIGFSQGGLFLRAYVQRCNSPPVRNLITLGSPHNGVADVPESMCRNGGIWCSIARGLIQKGAYLPFVQRRVVQAAYYKNPLQVEEYLQNNLFLPDINNEKSIKSELYKSRLLSLKNLVLMSFANDTMVVPKETASFGEIVNGTVKSLRELEIYTKDYLGLRTLDEEGRLHLLEVEGDHLQIDFDTFVSAIIQPFLSDPVEARHLDSDIIVSGGKSIEDLFLYQN
ncbi:palmitoyl-protein thioesterase 1 [Paraphysoderma sedebokerense]|nr:palmitoyl-protein thioesterase 1 [Paraphysoderma sedebokerense]